MSDDIVRALSLYGDFDEEASWDGFRAGYLLKTPEQRRADLATASQYIDKYTQEHSQPTRELSSLVTRRRDLEDIHWQLRRAGR
jgi:hypothetical protein